MQDGDNELSPKVVVLAADSHEMLA